MAVPVACADGPGLRGGRDQRRQGELLERHAEVPLRADRPCLAARRAAGERAREVGDRAWLLRPQRRRRLRGGLRGAGQGGRQAGAPAIHARPGHRLGPERPGLDPHGAGRARRPGQRHRLRVHQQGLLAGRRRHQRLQAVRHAGGPDARRRAEVRRRLRRAGGILRVRQQADLVGDHRAAARPRVAAAHLASARPGWPANPLRQRIVHGRIGGGDRPGPDRVPAEAHQGRARHRADQGRGGEIRLGHAAVAAARARPATR